MPNNLRALSTIIFAVLLACGLSGCGTVNKYLANGMGDYIPQWAGGLPADAPPRPGTPEYDAFMKEREAQRLAPKTAEPDKSKAMGAIH